MDEIYGMLKTYDLEVQQRKNKKGSKAKGVALTANQGSQGLRKRNQSSTRGKAKAVDTDESSPDDESDVNPDDSNTDDSSDEELVQMVAMIVKGFKKMKFRKQRKDGRSFRKAGKSENAERFKRTEGR